MMKQASAIIFLAVLSTGLTACQAGFWHAEKPRNQLLAERDACRQQGGRYLKDPASGHYACRPGTKDGTIQ